MGVMVKSDGNGAYIVDKKLWGIVMTILTILFGLVVWGGQEVVSDVKESVKANAVQDEQIKEMVKRFDRIEAKLDRVLEAK